MITARHRHGSPGASGNSDLAIACEAQRGRNIGSCLSASRQPHAATNGAVATQQRHGTTVTASRRSSDDGITTSSARSGAKRGGASLSFRSGRVASRDRRGPTNDSAGARNQAHGAGLVRGGRTAADGHVTSTTLRIPRGEGNCTRPACLRTSGCHVDGPRTSLVLRGRRHFDSAA